MRLEQFQQLLAEWRGQVAVPRGREVDDPPSRSTHILTVPNEHGGLAHPSVAHQDDRPFRRPATDPICGDAEIRHQPLTPDQ